MKRIFWIAVLLALPFSGLADTTINVESSGAVLRSLPVHLKVVVGTDQDGPLAAQVVVDGAERAEIALEPGENEVRLEDVRLSAGDHEISVRVGEASETITVRPIAGWLSVLPPLVAIVLALVFKDVLVSLFLGVFSGAWILVNWNPVSAFTRTLDTYIAGSLADSGQAKIVIFSTLLGGMVGIITKIGGTEGIVERMKGWATTARRGQVATWLMGLFIFFDDYANTLIVGSTMRPVTDRLRISREKLAYIVDSTAAPVSSVFPISTWIGFEVGLIASAFAVIGVDGQYDAYLAFINSIPYRFYPIFALVLGFVIACSCRDFGPMLAAERRTSETGKVLADDAMPLADYSSGDMQAPADIPKRAINALLPILAVVVVTLAGLWSTGSADLNRADYPSLFKMSQDVLSNASSNDALLWASFSGIITAVLLSIVQRLVPLRDAMTGMMEGFKAMLLAMVVLILAWSIGTVTKELHTADFVVGLAEGIVSPHWLGALVFISSAAIAFATGTSWGTMAILMPLAIPIAHGLSTAAGHAPGTDLYYGFLMGTISSVLAGSVWGDHCSPISDTTILSSMATGSDHIAHVKTQMPYALVAGFVGIVIGDIPAGYGLSPWISILVGSAVIVGTVFMLGKPSGWDGVLSRSPTDDAV